MPRQYPPHFRHDMVNRMLAGESVLALVQETSVPEQTLHRWKHQALIDVGLIDGVDSAESAQLRAANKRIKTLEKELQLVKDASELFGAQAVVPPKRRQAVAEGLVRRGHSIRSATTVSGVNRSTFGYRTRPKPPGNREIRRLVVADAIGQVHEGSRGTYGYRRVQAALRIERDLTVNHKLVAKVMANLGLAGLPRKRTRKRNLIGVRTSSDLANRDFTATGPNQLWVTDITEHSTTWIPAIVATRTGGSVVAGKKFTDAQKDKFFRLLDRGGTVRAAARGAGMHENAGYNLLRGTGLIRSRTTPRQYPPGVKEEFLRLVRERQILSTVARELGIRKPTAYSWARKAGISTSEARRVNPRREEFLRLRATGLTRSEARALVGADARSATDWDKGITIIKRGRIYPDGRIFRYPAPDNRTVKKTLRAIGGNIDLDRVEKVIHPRYLSLIEREWVQDLVREGTSIRGIAMQMGRSASTISRELRRNTISTRGYLPHTAH